MYRDLGFIRVWGSQSDGPVDSEGTGGAAYAYLIYPHRAIVAYLAQTHGCSTSTASPSRTRRAPTAARACPTLTTCWPSGWRSPVTSSASSPPPTCTCPGASSTPPASSATCGASRSGSARACATPPSAAPPPPRWTPPTEARPRGPAAHREPARWVARFARGGSRGIGERQRRLSKGARSRCSGIRPAVETSRHAPHSWTVGVLWFQRAELSRHAPRHVVVRGVRFQSPGPMDGESARTPGVSRQRGAQCPHGGHKRTRRPPHGAVCVVAPVAAGQSAAPPTSPKDAVDVRPASPRTHRADDQTLRPRRRPAAVLSAGSGRRDADMYRVA